MERAPRWGRKVADRFPLVFGISAFGHLFICSEKRDRFAVIVTDRPELIQLNSSNMQEFTEEFLRDPDVRSSLFRESDFSILVERLGALKLDECFYPVPYPAIGGSGALATFECGNAWVYLEIYGQTIGF